MKLSFHPEAEDEFDRAIDDYEKRQRGLGMDFSIEVYAALQRISDHPLAWPVLEDEVHRCLTHRFPYGILYTVESDGIFILTVMHLHRNPDYWKERMSR